MIKGNKETKTISFDKHVLDTIKRRAKIAGTTVSRLINTLCKRHYIGDYDYYFEMEKQCRVKAEEYRIIRENIIDKKLLED